MIFVVIVLNTFVLVKRVAFCGCVCFCPIIYCVFTAKVLGVRVKSWIANITRNIRAPLLVFVRRMRWYSCDDSFDVGLT